MILLDGHTLNQRNRFTPESFQLQIEERDSSATITVGPDAPEIAVGDWMKDDTEPGKGIVWRVRSIEHAYRDNTRTINLEHVIKTLQDTVIFGEVSTSKLGGGSAKKAVEYILGQQDIWVLGDFEYDLTAPFEFNSDTLLEALEEISSALADNVWEYDLTALPFKLHIRQQDQAVKCEMRGGRNLSTIQKTIDRSRMYTRIYPIGRDDLHIDGSYIEQNTDLYGVISKVETDQAYSKKAQLRRWAEDRLRRHCEPTVTITITGLELSQETGEPLDKLTIGTVCRVPVPELGVVMAEKITRLQWRDKIQDPQNVSVTLANNREDVVTIFKRRASTAEKAGRSGASAGGATRKHIDEADQEIYTSITRTAEEIRLEAVNNKKELQAAIDVQADRISLVVEGTGNNKHIKAASIVASINDAGSEVVISASHIQLAGNVNLNNCMTASGIGVNFLKSVNMTGSNGISIGAGGYISLGAYSIHLDTLQGMIKSAKAEGNVLTLTPFYGSDITFSKATTLSGKWSGGTYTVTAKQNSETVGTNTAQIKQLTQNGNVSVIGKYVGQNVHVYATENGGSNSVSTGFSQEIWIDASDVYEDGKRDGAGAYTLFGYFDKYGTVTVEGQTYTAYITQDTSASASHLALYKK